jgi:Uma2 family endonuclease
MSASTLPTTAGPRSNGAIPPLETGDHLSREEFFRRWEAHPEITRAERIEGVVYVAAAALRLEQHAEPHSDLIAWLNVYRARTRGLRIGTSATTKLDLDNDFQPDVILLIPRALGGQAEVDANGYVAGSPELAAEVSASTASMDMQTKKNVYRRNGVREYLVWKVMDEEIVWFVLQGSEYVLMIPDAAGIVRSTVYPGLWLDVPAMLEGNLERVLEVLQQGLATPEHAEFARDLAARAAQ